LKNARRVVHVLILSCRPGQSRTDETIPTAPKEPSAISRPLKRLSRFLGLLRTDAEPFQRGFKALSWGEILAPILLVHLAE
jgi:hypothetical protein